MERATSFVFSIPLALFFILGYHQTDAYPILIDIRDNAGVCVNLDIPDNDDVHMIFSNLPDEVDAKIESWAMTEMSAIADHNSHKFLKTYSTPPQDIVALTKKTGYVSNIDVTITGPGRQTRKQRLSPFKIIVIKEVVKNMKPNLHLDMFDGPDDDWAPDKGSYEICFKSDRGRVSSHAAFEHLLISDFEEKLRNKHILKKEHLTPIEMNFESSIVTLRSIVNEMNSLERREARMKHTSDSMNQRVRYFSYISIAILLGVTWLQISYLKVYFKKKKVL